MIHNVFVDNNDFKLILKSTRVGKRLGKANYLNEQVDGRVGTVQLKVTVVGAEKNM